MRRAREGFPGPRRHRRRVQGDRPGTHGSPRVHGMVSVRPLVRSRFVAGGVVVRRIHDRRVRLTGRVRADLPRLHDHVHPVALIGYIAADKGASSVSLLRPAFGLRGSKLPSVFYLFFGYGWAAVNVFIAAISMSFVFNLTLGWPDAFHTSAGSPINYYLVPSILLVCFLQGFFATAGHRAIRYLNWASTIALVVLGAYASYIVLKDFDFGQLWAWRPAQPLSFTFTAGALGTGFTYTLTFPLLLDLLIAYNWTWEFIGDFSRFARSKKAGTWGPFAGASLAQYWFFSVGALMTVAFLVTAPAGSVNFAAISDPSYNASQLGFGLGAYLIILFATISTNAGNIYASALGITNIATP